MRMRVIPSPDRSKKIRSLRAKSFSPPAAASACAILAPGSRRRVPLFDLAEHRNAQRLGLPTTTVTRA
jgi:hypothetical protein